MQRKTAKITAAQEIQRRIVRIDVNEYRARIELPSELPDTRTYWLLRAEELRTIAVEIRDPICRRIMECVAKSYDTRYV